VLEPLGLSGRAVGEWVDDGVRSVPLPWFQQAFSEHGWRF